MRKKFKCTEKRKDLETEIYSMGEKMDKKNVKSDREKS